MSCTLQDPVLLEAPRPDELIDVGPAAEREAGGGQGYLGDVCFAVHEAERKSPLNWAMLCASTLRGC